MTVFEQELENIREVPPGHVMVIKRSGRVFTEQFTPPRQRASCSFERIYFSRGNDRDIYRERKALGAGLAAQILEAVEHDLEHTVFSYIPNTAETAFEGLLEALRSHRRAEVKNELMRAVRE